MMALGVFGGFLSFLMLSDYCLFWFTRPIFFINYVSLIMSLYFVFFSLLMFFCGFCILVLNHVHFLVVLLGLEYLVIRIFSLFVFLSYFFYVDIYFRIIFLTFSVCEGRLGLAVLVGLSRTHGDDNFGSFNVLQC